VDPVFRQALGDYFYLMRTPDIDEMHRLVDFVQG